MTRILVVGDTHGGSQYEGGKKNDRHVGYKMEIAKKLGADRLMIVGDFGMWPGFSGIQFLDDLQEMARKYNMSVFALPGNHEDHDQWNHWLNMGLPTSSGFTYIRERVLISPKVHYWKWDNKRFFITGGAVSVDKQWRTQGESWWANETFSENDLASVLKYSGPPVDYLFSHDCSDHTVFKERIKPDLDSQDNRKRIDKAIAHLKPRFQFHGHMHNQYDWVNTQSHGQKITAFGTDDSEWSGASTMTYGLECNSEENSWGLLDTNEDKFYWPKQAMALLDSDS